MNIDKVEYPKIESLDKTDDYPLIQKMNSRPASTALNGSLEESIEYSTYEPEAIAVAPAPAPAQSRVVNNMGNTAAQEVAFNPAKTQARVKKCSKCLVIFGWILIILGGINIVGNLLQIIFMSGDFLIQYTDVDGQYVSLKVDANTMLTFAIFKIIAGSLTVWMGKVTHRTFKPIVKEYRDAERGVTQGIAMNTRRSKKMQHMKKKICKISALMLFFGFLTVIYTKNFMHGMVDQFLDQKYDYIQQHNGTGNLTYSVEEMRKELYNETIPVPEEQPPMQGEDGHFEHHG